MSNFKHGKPRHQRAGCHHCKPWKDERDSKAKRAPKVMRKIPVPDTFKPITLRPGASCPVCEGSEEYCTCGNVVWLT